MAVSGAELPSTTGLPRYLTRYTGRERETAEFRQLLDRHDERLVTVSGPGGVGKTRFVVETIAAWQREQRSMPVVFVDGAALAAPTELMPALAQQLGLEQFGEETSGGQVSELLAARSALIVFDNMEHLLDAALGIAALLRACPDVRIVATSRTPLRLSSERVFPVEPLATSSAADGGWSAAAILFLDRAGLVRGTRDRTIAGRVTIEAICRRVDGLPLAIELAAARLRLLSPDVLLSLLNRQLAILGTDAVDTPVRHRTLESAIAWSYDLLGADDRRVFRQLGVFPESFTLAAVEAVCVSELSMAERREVALDRVTTLFEQGLLQKTIEDTHGDRYRMLVSIQDFARARLQESGERKIASERLARFVASFAEERASELIGPRQAEAMHELAAESANVRAGVDWAVAHPETDIGLRLIGALWRFWANRGLLKDGRAQIDRIMLGRTPELTALFGNAARGAAVIAEMQTDWRAARAWNTVAIGIWEALPDLGSLSRSWIDLGNIASSTGELDQARAAYERSMSLANEVNDERMVMVARCSIGAIALRQGRHRDAAEQFEYAIPFFRQQGDQWVLATALSNLGIALGEIDERPRAVASLRESLEIRRALGDEIGIAATSNNLAGALDLEGDAPAHLEEALEIALRLDAADLIGPVTQHLGIVAMRQGEPDVAAGHFAVSLRSFQGMESPVFVAETVELIAELIAPLDSAAAARLLGGTAAVRARRDVEWRGPFAEQARKLEFELRRSLGVAAYADLHEQGAQLDVPALAIEALTALHRVGNQPDPSRDADARLALLSPRERMVLRLLAQGMSDREIGTELFISPKTVNRHVTSILAKLECRNRAAAAAVAFLLGFS